MLDAFSLSPADRAAFAAALDHLEGIPRGAAAVRADSLRRHATPLDLGCELNPNLRRTPALELLAEELERAITVPGSRLIVSFSPQEGKTWSLRWALLRKLQRDPESRSAIASYAVDLARASGRAIRQTIEVHGTGAIDPATAVAMPDRLGIAVSADHAAAADWSLRGHLGGLVCVGVGSGLTGRPIDGVLAVDDPIKDARDADSELIRSRLHDWWAAVSETRLAPEASVVVIATRWHELDLSGWLQTHDEMGEWRVVNIPALADGHAPDALGRPVGVWMESVRGRTPEQWQRIRRRVGERVFAAMYQGMPAPPEGGVFRQEWFDRDRVVRRPADGLPPVVVVDPADNTGGGDEAGVLVASIDPRQRIYLGPDLSGHMTSGRWVRVALLAVVRHQGAALAYEQSLSGLDRAVRAGWQLIHKQALVLRRRRPPDAPLDPEVMEVATAELCHPDDPDTTWSQVRAELVELWPLVDQVLAYPPTGPNIRRIVAKGTKQWRAQSVAPMFEQRRVSMVGHSPQLEHQAVTWMPGQDSPDRMDAMVHAVMHLSGAAPGEIVQSTGDTLPTRSTRLRQRGGASMLPRSTR